MTQVFTDARFAGLEVSTAGRPLFEVRLNGRLLTTFESWDRADGTMGPECAARRAADYFDRCGVVSVREAEERWRELNPPGQEKVFNAPPSGMHNSRVIDRMVAKEKTETDPEKKRMLRHNIMKLMQQEGSTAGAVVSDLLDC